MDIDNGTKIVMEKRQNYEAKKRDDADTEKWKIKRKRKVMREISEGQRRTQKGGRVCIISHISFLLRHADGHKKEHKISSSLV